MKIGTLSAPPTTNMRLTRRTSDGLLGFRPDHEARRVAQRDDRQAEGIAQLHEARRLVGARSVDGAGQMHRIVGDQAERRAFDADQRRDHAGREFGAQLQHRAGVGERRDHLAALIDAQAVLRDEVAQLLLVRRIPLPSGPWK